VSSAAPNPAQLIKEGFLCVLLLVLFSVAPPGNFSADALDYLRVKYSKTKPFIILAIIMPKRVTSLLCPSPRHNAKAKQLPV